MKTTNYAELTKNENIILNNNIISAVDDWEIINGYDFDDEEELADVYQWYIIDCNFAEYLQDATGEIVYYSERFDLYLWGVTHFGTSWDMVTLEVKTYNYLTYE